MRLLPVHLSLSNKKFCSALDIDTYTRHNFALRWQSKHGCISRHIDWTIEALEDIVAPGMGEEETAPGIAEVACHGTAQHNVLSLQILKELA